MHLKGGGKFPIFMSCVVVINESIISVLPFFPPIDSIREQNIFIYIQYHLINAVSEFLFHRFLCAFVIRSQVGLLESQTKKSMQCSQSMLKGYEIPMTWRWSSSSSLRPDMIVFPKSPIYRGNMMTGIKSGSYSAVIRRIYM